MDLMSLGGGLISTWVVVVSKKNMFTPNLGEMIQFDLRIFLEMGWFNHQLGPLEHPCYPAVAPERNYRGMVLSFFWINFTQLGLGLIVCLGWVEQLVVWIPGIPWWEGLSTLESQTTNPNQQLTINWLIYTMKKTCHLQLRQKRKVPTAIEKTWPFAVLVRSSSCCTFSVRSSIAAPWTGGTGLVTLFWGLELRPEAACCVGQMQENRLLRTVTSWSWSGIPSRARLE